MTELSQLDAAIRLAIAALIGLGVGLEREWSGHASGPDARFAGLRTFLLIGLLGGSAGLLLALGQSIAGAVVAAGGGVFAVTAYVMAARREGADLDGTTEAAALVVVALGVTAGIGWLGLAGGAGALTVLALSEKARLHWIVRRVEERELRAALQFAVLALVVLPLLPNGPYLGDLAIRPRLLWALVLMFSGINFVGYIARKVIGPDRGYGVAGAVGGLLSSTAVTLTFSRHSKVEPGVSASLARGVIAAATVMLVRTFLLTSALGPAVAQHLWPLLAPPTIAGLALVGLWKRESHGSESAETAPGNPLRLGSAMKMAVLFQAGMIAVALVAATAGEGGLYATGAILGATDADALTVSMTRRDAALDPMVAARVIAIGALSASVLKLVLCASLGSAPYRRIAMPAMAALAGASALGLWLF